MYIDIIHGWKDEKIEFAGGIFDPSNQLSTCIQERQLWHSTQPRIRLTSSCRQFLLRFKLTLGIYRPIDGISTYNVVPFEAGAYFNKIQCFCFEEQRLNPGEEVDMPVFFYIDPDFEKDPFLQDTNEITLSYTFFESKPGLQLPTYNPSVMNK